MKTIYKYALVGNSVKDSQYVDEIALPRDARILRVDTQGGRIFLWAEVDLKQPEESRLIYCIGTGHGAVPEDGDYIGSTIGDVCCWHFYLKRQP